MDHHNGLQIGGQVGKVPRKGVYIIWKSPLKVRQFPEIGVSCDREYA